MSRERFCAKAMINSGDGGVGVVEEFVDNSNN
jgi:hypothetical protein